MPSSDDEVVLTGMGQVSALGHGCAALWAAICEGRDGLRPVRRFPLPPGGPGLAGLVPGHDGPLPDAEPGYLELFRRFALDAAREAIGQAGAGGVLGGAPARAALVMGTNTLFDTVPPQELASSVAAELGIRGPRICVGTACSASTLAIGLGRDLLESGAADLVLAGGTDVLAPDVFAGFQALGLLSPGRCAPFSAPPGTVLAEGAGFVVLERRRRAEARGAPLVAALLGYGLSDDAYHETTPDPAGAGVARAVTSALLDAGVPPGALGHVNAHATGTEANDAAEWRGLGRAIGEPLARIPVSGPKSFLGHAQGAAGVLELIASLLSLRNQAVPPTLHFTGPRLGCPADPVAASAPRPHRWQVGLSTNSAFAGANAAVVFALPDQRRDRRPSTRPVFVRGAGAVGPHGLGLSALRDHLAAAAERGAPGRPGVRPFALEELVPSADPRRLDPSSRFLAAAVASALGEAKLQVSGELRARAGLMVGSSRVSPETNAALLDSIRERGLWKLSSAAFARRVLGAPAGACARLLSLRGPTGTLATGAGASLVAVACGAHHLATRSDVEVLVAGGFDERGAGAGPGEGEGAGCLVLASGPGAGPAVRLAGWGLAGPGDAAAAVREALARAGVDGADVELASCREEEAAAVRGLDRARRVDPEVVLGRSDSAGPALGLAAAYAAVRDGPARTAVVFSAGGSAACAVLLQRCS